MRKFAIVVLDETDQIKLDAAGQEMRRELPKVTDIGGLGYTLSISKIETDIEDYVTKIVQSKKKISLKIHHDGGYAEANDFDAWCESHLNETMCLEYNDGTRTRYADGKIVDASRNELNTFGTLEETIQFQPLTPFFEIVENAVEVSNVNVGKSYPFVYPYTYGVLQIVNNEIVNSYIREMPLIITVKGSSTLVVNPVIAISANGAVYGRIKLNATLNAAQTVIINSAKRKVYYSDGQTITDAYNWLDEHHDSYIQIAAGATSKITVKDDSGGFSGTLIGRWRKYGI